MLESPAGMPPCASAPQPAAPEALLQAQHLTKRFGGLTAVDDVSLELIRGQIHGLIGPNGAGKSTLTQLLSGDLTLTGGQLQLLGMDVTGYRAAQIAQLGLSRNFQKTNVFLPFSVFENVRLAARFDLASTAQAIRCARLEHQTHTIAAQISHGEQRQLEIAMCIASRPQVLLLDEPLAGMGPQEAAQMIELLQSLKTQYAILLIEHDMEAVFTLADRLTVMVDGRVIATGTPSQIRSDIGVQAAYLGEAYA